MSDDEVMTLLDTLLEAERAGVKALAVVLEAYPAGVTAREQLAARYCGRRRATGH
jgi:hypothetical protein